MGVLLIWLVTFLLILDSSSAAAKSAVCDRCVHQSNATFFSNDDAAVLNGTCGYGIQAKILSGGSFSGVKPVIYKNGGGCGACYQVRCKDEKNCTEKGITIIVTDVSNNEKNRTGFVLSQTAFKGMAKTEAGSNHLMKLVSVDVEYQRVPCEYGKKKNMSIRVERTSRKENGYLAIILLYQGGQADIESIEVAQAKKIWWEGSLVSLARTNNGALWDTNNVPKGPLGFRFKVKYRDVWKLYVTSTKHAVLPANWTNDETVYDSGIQITDINATSAETCKTCSNVWK